MTAPFPILAKFPAELWIYLFFGVLWVIGVISERIKKNSQAARRPTAPTPVPAQPMHRKEEPAEETPPKMDLEDLERQFRELIGAEVPEEAPAPPPPPRTPAPVLQGRPTPVEPRIVFDPRVTLDDRTTALAYKPDDAFAQLEEIQDIEQVLNQELAAGKGANPHSLLINLGQLKMPTIRTPVLTLTQAKERTHHRDLRERAALREAVVSNVILGPPKGL